jgi:hypothetical protein
MIEYLAQRNKTEQTEEANNKHEADHPTQRRIYNIHRPVTRIISPDKLVGFLIHRKHIRSEATCVSINVSDKPIM